ncbi:hypothetical protein MtrunA17_Chr6g0470811 [Medicago truncatula]|uniref:TraB family protein n=1 Tax=Medicago truncatula TaxID=3880 RepID=A0A396HEE7_MEDTR|nr:hypothetical protein MtrunA17_Chr6g0470811 [Medicago truncatula]
MNVLRSRCCLSTRLRKVIQTTFTTLPCFSTTSAAFCRDQSPEKERQRRLELPKELTKNVIQLSCDSMEKGGVCDVYLVGTFHGNKESSKQVEEIVKFLKPEVVLSFRFQAFSSLIIFEHFLMLGFCLLQIVFLELCSDRQEVLLHDNMEALTMGEMNDAMRKEKYSIFRMVTSWLDAEIDSRCDGYPFAQFRSAYKEAIKYSGIVVLGDRRLEITLKRTWSKLPLWHIPKLLIACFPTLPCD